MATDRQLVAFFIREARRHKWGYLIAFMLMPACSAVVVGGPKLFQLAIDNGILAGNARYLAGIAMALLVIMILQAVLIPLQQILVQSAGIRTLREIRAKIVTQIAHLGRRDFEQRPLGVFISRATSDVEAIGESLSTGLLSILSDMVTIIAVLIAVFSMNSRLGIVTLCIVPVIAVIIDIFRRRVRGFHGRLRTLNGRLAAKLDEIVTMRNEVLNFDLVGPSVRDFGNMNHAYRQTAIRAVSYDATIYSIVEALSHMTVGVVLLMVARNWFFSQTVSVGSLAMYLLLLQQLFLPFRELAQRFTTIQSTFAALKKIDDILAIPLPPDAGTKHPHSNHLAVSKVGFAYEPGNPVLRDVSFEVPACGSLALVGPTGSGKTTVVRLLTRLYDVEEGSISIGGLDLRDIPRDALRGTIALVPQDPMIFRATLAENIGIANPSISRDAIEDICRKITAHEFISRLPAGYETPLESGGTNLSMGQRQLISLARALVSGAQILLFDESTASIDTQTELMIQRALDFVMTQRTTIIIAHRLSTIRHVDHILVLSDGRIVQQGTHSQLLTSGGLYRDMYHLQRTDY